jgi:hypothetical protein
MTIRTLTVGGSTAYDLSRSADFEADLAAVVARVNRGDVIVVAAASRAQRERAHLELCRAGKQASAQIAEVGERPLGTAVRVMAGRHAGRAAVVVGYVGRAVTYLFVAGFGLANSTEEQFRSSEEAARELAQLGLGPPREVELPAGGADAPRATGT